MRFRFGDDDLQRLYEESDFRPSRLGPKLVKVFRKRMAFLAAAESELDLRNYRGLHYEQLAGKRSGQQSIKLDDQWRLILQAETDSDGRLLVIVAIDDYH
jgi:toxin HigB-1